MRALCLLLMVFSFGPALAELKVPGLGQDAALLSAETSKAVSRPPNPGNLSADWWRYFAVDSAQLQQRIEQSSDLLKKLSGDASADIKAAIDGFTDNLQRYRELRDKSTSEPAVSLDIQDTYSLQQWLDIVRKRQSLQTELQSEREDVKQEDKRNNALRQQLDTQMAAYLELPEQAADKFRHGLQIMVLWSGHVLAGEKLRLKKAILSASDVQLLQLSKEVKAARGRLVVNDQDIEQLTKEIKTAEQSRSQARAQLTRLLAEVEVDQLDTEEGNARSLLSKQIINHASIKETVADALWSRKRMEYLLMRMRVSKTGSS